MSRSPPAVEHDVGERAADIDGHADVGQQALHDRVGCHQDFRPVLTGAGGFIGQMGSAVAACAGRSSCQILFSVLVHSQLRVLEVGHQHAAGNMSDGERGLRRHNHGLWRHTACPEDG